MPSFAKIKVDATAEELLVLPQHYRDVLAGVQGDLGYAQIAGVLNVPIGTVRSRLNRARAALAKLRTEKEPEVDRRISKAIEREARS